MQASSITFHTYGYEELTTGQLYLILALRSEVFVLEQRSPYLDIDGLDQKCIHTCAYLENDLIGYARVAPPGLIYEQASFGRFVIAKPHRGIGCAHKLIKQVLEVIKDRFGAASIKIEAQKYLVDFYKNYNFEKCSDFYDLEGVEHCEMVRVLK